MFGRRESRIRQELMRMDADVMTREHPLGNTPRPNTLLAILRGGLVIVARTHKCSRNNILIILFFLNLAIANLYRRF
jgi:hypothetical protein